MKRKELTMSENFDLITLIKAEYTSSGMDDKAFAEYAKTKFSWADETMNSTAIRRRRVEFNIPNGRTAKPAQHMDIDQGMVIAHEVRLQNVAERLEILEAWVNLHFPTKGPRKVVG